MNISFNELREIKHNLPTGSVKRIAETLGIEEQTVRNYFGANKFGDGEIVENMYNPVLTVALYFWKTPPF